MLNVNHEYHRLSYFFLGEKGLKYPPGPKGLPILGNLGIMPVLYDHLTQAKLKKEYGDIMSISVLGTRIIFVNSPDIASDLFEKRSSVYSDRHAHHAVQLAGWDWNVAFMRYGERWRRHRRTFHQYFNANAVKEYEGVQVDAACDLIRRLYSTPEDYEEHIRYYAAWIIMKVVYNYELERKNDSYVDIVHIALEGIGETMNPGSFYVDFLPWLQYIPAWFPGPLGKFARKAAYWYGPTKQVAVMPFAMVQKRIAEGTEGTSVIATSLAKLAATPPESAQVDQEEVIRNITGIAYAAGAGTSLGGLLTILLTLLLFPDVQKKAQAEIDEVIGDRLPTLEDREALPYLNAFCDETQRWRPVTPFGIAHAASRDDVYRGFFIPRGSIVIGNSWNVLRDEKTYGPNVEDFDPERFLKPGVPSPTAQFGYGRRICPGRYLASGSLFMAAAMIVKVFNITPAKDANGDNIPVPGDYTGDGVVVPKTFKCSIKPRSALAKKLILESGGVA
ncbi:hypothetical protein M422DRAFT_162762 [Sphaerobolus stellatus SS14]|nr:hypothetical protein M422DRAFT_162762 [Sphaerobolus stellatus SS14]